MLEGPEGYNLTEEENTVKDVLAVRSTLPFPPFLPSFLPLKMTGLTMDNNHVRDTLLGTYILKSLNIPQTSVLGE